MNPGPKRFSDVPKFKACISEWKCFMFLFFIILSMFIFDHVLTYPFRTLCMRNTSCNSTESNFRQHFELNLHHVVRICPNLINMTHQLLISVAKRSRRMMFKQYLSKRSYFYARLLLLLLLLAGDVERNPGPIQDVIKEHCLQSESTTFIGDKTKGMLQGQDSKTSSKDDCERKRRLEQFAESQRKHREKESVEQQDMRLKTMQAMQKSRLKLETDTERDKRLGTLAINQKRRLEKETPQEHDERLALLAINQKRRFEKETPQEHDERLALLAINQTSNSS